MSYLRDIVMEYSAYARKRKSVATPSGTSGEDGDFVQLRIVRERRKISQESEKLRSIPETTSVNGARISFDEPESRKQVMGVKRPTTAARIERIQTLRIRLFTAVDQEEKTEITALMNDINKIQNIAEVRDPETDFNVLHYAASTGKLDIARTIINSCQEDMRMSHHKIEFSGVQGKQSALHIFTEKHDIKMAKFLLDRLQDNENRMKLLKLETAVFIQGQRPRLFSCLHLAAFYGHTDMIQMYLDYGMPINHINGKKDTSLLWASKWGHNDAVEFLLNRGADTEVSNDKGSTALYWAIRYEHPKTVELLLQKGGANPNTQRKIGLVSPIIIASAYGQDDIVELLLQHPDTDVNIKIRGGERAIHHAAKEGCLGVMKKLVSKGASIHDTDDTGDTPLLHAAENGHVDIVEYLIMEGADLDHRNHEGRDAWYYAMENEDNNLLHALVMACHNYDRECKKPLYIAANNGKCDKVKFLLKLNLDPMSADSEGNTFLHHAAMKNQFEIIDQFNETISLNVQNKRKNTPLHIACLKGHHETVNALLKYKAKADVKNEKGETALHVAAYSKYITSDCVKELVDYTINTHAWESLNAKDFLGNNCLHIAGKFAQPDVLWEFRQVRFKDRDQDGLTPLHESVRPDEPEALEKMLDIFETFSRDAKINEQSYATSETVLHLAAEECHVKCVKRLIHLGADLSIKDINGDTVLHRLTKASVADSRHAEKHVEVMDIIFENVVKWWCIKENKSFPEEDNQETYQMYRKKATLFLVNGICNNDGLSVTDQAFKYGASQVIYRLLMMPGVTMFEDQNSFSYTFDLTGLTPRTSYNLQGCCGAGRVGPLGDGEFTKFTNGLVAEPRLSGIEWLVANTGGMQAAQILDIPPIRMIEEYYTSMVAWTFALLMFFHIIYMSVFTYIGVNLLGKLRDDSTGINESDAETILLYVFVPLEPLLIVIYVFYLVIRYLITRDIGRRSRLSKRRGVSMVLNILASYAFIVVCFVYAVLVFAWIGLFTTRYRYQDYVLAAAILIGWLLTIAFTRGIKKIHYFYRMLISMILRDVVRFIIVYLFVLMAFGFAFHILFQVSKAVSNDFSTPGDTLFLTFNMMVGMDEIFTDDFDTNMAAVDRDTTYIKVFYLLYIILATVILLNLLIAMMNDSYQMILKNNQVLWRIESVGLGIEMESNFPATKVFTNVKLKNGNTDSKTSVSDDHWYVTISSKHFQQLMDTIEKQSNTQDAVTKRLEELEERQIEMEKQTMQKLNHLTELLEKKREKRDRREKKQE